MPGERREARIVRRWHKDYRYKEGDEVCVVSMKKTGTVVAQGHRFPGEKAYEVQLHDGATVHVTERQLGPVSLCVDEQTQFAFIKEGQEEYHGPSWFGMSAYLLAAAAVCVYLVLRSRRIQSA